MTDKELQLRTKSFAIQIIRLIKDLPKDLPNQVVAKQLIRSATSIAANYRAVCRAKSVKDFIAKLAIVIEEADETGFWLELIRDSKIAENLNIDILIKEADELTAIMVASRNSAIKNQKLKTK